MSRSSSRGRVLDALSAILGVVVVGLSVTVGVVDAHHAIGRWSTMGPLPPGDVIPAFEVVRTEGGSFSNSDLPGKVSIVTFWATWCGVCRDELADLDELYEGYDDQDVQFVAINSEGSGVTEAQAGRLVESYRQRRSLALPMAVDTGAAAKSFRVGPIPHTVVFDRQGELRFVHQGRVLSSTISAEIEQLLAP